MERQGEIMYLAVCILARTVRDKPAKSPLSVLVCVLDAFTASDLFTTCQQHTWAFFLILTRS